MSKKAREDAVSRMRRGESWIMITTEVMARGMDFKGVREVINYDFPQSVQSYVHRIGNNIPVIVLSWLTFARANGAGWTRGEGGDIFHGCGCTLPQSV
jgi:hypothetical protein